MFVDVDYVRLVLMKKNQRAFQEANQNRKANVANDVTFWVEQKLKTFLTFVWINTENSSSSVFFLTQDRVWQITKKLNKKLKTV